MKATKLYFQREMRSFKLDKKIYENFIKSFLMMNIKQC